MPYYTMQPLAQHMFRDINHIRAGTVPAYFNEAQKESNFVIDELQKWSSGGFAQYEWNEGLARAARHYLNERGACGTNGDADGFGFRSLLSAFYVWTYEDLEY